MSSCVAANVSNHPHYVRMEVKEFETNVEGSTISYILQPNLSYKIKQEPGTESDDLPQLKNDDVQFMSFKPETDDTDCPVCCDLLVKPEIKEEVGLEKVNEIDKNLTDVIDICTSDVHVEQYQNCQLNTFVMYSTSGYGSYVYVC